MKLMSPDVVGHFAHADGLTGKGLAEVDLARAEAHCLRMQQRLA